MNILTCNVDLKDCISYLDLLSNVDRKTGCNQKDDYHTTPLSLSGAAV